jgi:hypothetical protein
VTGGWRILYDKRLHNFCPEPNMIIKWRTMRLTGHVAYMGKINAHVILIRKPKGKWLLGRAICWERGRVYHFIRLFVFGDNSLH